MSVNRKTVAEESGVEESEVRCLNCEYAEQIINGLYLCTFWKDQYIIESDFCSFWRAKNEGLRGEDKQ